MMELQTLDQQLKVAIQNHQILVAKMKSDPQNGNLQRMLHELQSRIRTLSERQKQVVQQLRKDLEIKKQAPATGSGTKTNNNNNNNNHGGTVVSKGVYTQPISLPQQVTPLSLTMKQVDTRFTTILLPSKVTVGAAVNCVSGSASSVLTVNGNEFPPANSSSAQVVTLTATTTATLLPPNATSIIYRPPPPTLSPPHLITTTSTSDHHPPANRIQTPIRVPQYPPPLRPSSSSSPSAPTPLLAPSSVLTTAVATANNNNLKAMKVMSRNNEANSLDPNNQKKKFMAALGLITHDMLTELKSRKSERKRRTTANPQFSYGNWDHHLEKKSSAHYLASPMPAGFKRPRGRPRLGSTTPSSSRPSTPEDHLNMNGSSEPQPIMRLVHNGLITKEDSGACSICRLKDDEVMVCHSCHLGYHSACLQHHSPNTLKNSNKEQMEEPPHWTCPNCKLIKKKSWPNSVKMVHSYILHKTAKEEEKRQLVERGEELRVERDELEQRSQLLTQELSTQVKTRTELLLDTKMTMESIEQLKTSIRLLQTS